MNPKPNLCVIRLTDPQGNSVELFISEDETIDKWIEAFRKILKFQEFHNDLISAHLGED